LCIAVTGVSFEVMPFRNMKSLLNSIDIKWK